MTKADRAKMRERVLRVFPTFASCGGAFEEICEVVAREVDRAVRAARRTCRESDESLASAIACADARLIEEAKVKQR